MEIETILNIERAILSTIIFDPIQYEEIASQLKPNDFYHPFHQHIFISMDELIKSEQPIDEEFLKESLNKKNQFNEANFLDVLSATPISNVSAYIEQIKEHSQKNRLNNLALKIREKIEKGENVSSLINYFESQIELIQKGSSTKEYITIFDALQEKDEPTIIYSTGIDFLDNIFDGGFETGQLITITGEQEAGKTQLVNQILFNVARGFNCLYFSLEFNKRQLKAYTKKKIKACNLDIDRFKNITLITDEMHTGEINDILLDIKREYRKNSTKFIVIDSQMMLFDDDESLKYATGEERVTSIFRKLHSLSKKLDIVILLIAQASKEDAKAKKIEIFGSKKAAHLARIMIHINYNREADAEGKENGGQREIFIAKNKQNGKLAKIKVNFDREKLEFITDTVITNSTTINKEQKPRSVLDLI